MEQLINSHQRTSEGCVTNVDIVQNEYLAHLEKELRLLPLETQQTIANRVESYINEVCFLSNCTPQEALPYLGDLRVLVIQFLEEEISLCPKISLKRLHLVAVYYYLTGMVELVTRPVIVSLSVILFISGLCVVLLALFNTGAYMMAENQSSSIPLSGILEINPFLALVFSLLFGSLLIGGGLSLWKFIKRHVAELQAKASLMASIEKNEKYHAQKQTSKRRMISINAAEIDENEA